MKNRNLVDNFSWSIVFCTTQVRILYSTHGGCNRRLTEASFLPHVRAGQNPAGPPLCSEHPHSICTIVKHVHSASRADWKWSILGAVYYRRWIKCAAVVRTSQNGQFFIKSSILVLSSQHPHDIYLFTKHVCSASRADWKWFILGVVYCRSWMECTAVVKTSQNGQFFIKSSIRSSDLNIRMISASLPNM